MKKLIIMTYMLAVAAVAVKAQDTIKTTGDAPLVISGSVDAYYKYDFSGHRNIPTSFASDQNSFSIGMVDLALKKTVGKASFVGEVSFGPRSDQSLPAAGANYHIQNLYVSYNVTDKFSLAGGYMATFIGYEVISPAANFNYSTSYLFTYGPFQNAGVKATYVFSEKVSLMAGVFNDQWNVYQSTHNIDAFGAQLTISPVKGWTAYLNILTANNSTPTSGTVLDLTTAYQITGVFKLGLNAADYSASNGAGKGGYSGVALYPQLAVSKAVAFGLRGEYFKVKNSGPKVAAFTLTSNIKAGPLTLMPELRLDNNNDKLLGFTKNDGTLSSTAAQFVLAAVYAF
ncbi:porin [Mucilaginibacter sp.]|uniref:porin n=1 Tax=Mucilaginibacter sp. TaxID=1882438 RepID=UPI002627799F|nr:porin [Mucilaginibacter sp.]